MGVTVTVSVVGVVPLAGETLSQFPLLAPALLAVAVAVKPKSDPGLATKTVCAGGAAPPAATEKVSDAGLKMGPDGVENADSPQFRVSDLFSHHGNDPHR